MSINRNIQIRKIVYFVRHGESEGNVLPVFQSSDSPLTEKGREQAEYIAKRVSKLSFETLLASPWERTRQTAEIIAKVTGKKPEYCKLFVERKKPSCINGKYFSDEKAMKIWQAWEKSLYTPNMRVEDGENFDDITARADRALDFLERRPEKSLLVVTHGYFLRTIVARVLLGDLLTAENFRNIRYNTGPMENTGLTVLQYCEGLVEKPIWRLWIFNDHAHLAD
jgi:probable phosphoglycerate mutase